MPPTRSTTNKTPSKTPSKTLGKTPRNAASSSKVTLDGPTLTGSVNIPPAEVPETLTPGYSFQPRDKGAGLSEEERAKLIHELVGFDPRSLCKDITESARSEVYSTLDAIEAWAKQICGNNPKMEMELATASLGNLISATYQSVLSSELLLVIFFFGLVALETLLESHVDKAFDKFTAWVLRNAFEFSPELDPVLPWQKGLDFARGEYVAALPNGQQALDDSLESVRTQVEQRRLLAQKLDEAERALDRRVEIAKQRRAEVGFVQEIIESAGMSTLSQPSTQLLPTIKALHDSLQPLEPISLSGSTSAAFIPPPGTFTSTGTGTDNAKHTKAWEMGRAAYLNWALNKIVRAPAGAARQPGTGTLTEEGNNDQARSGIAAGAGSAKLEIDRLEGIEKGIEGVVDDKEGIERAMGNV
ncbi:hypothetical protein I316_06089 [Kwoniella heveanensis BCC8398]|uniref:Uncharacterized protein n=1 Tax=Kwoniella heveanensis BCC8398 TaxID=1296120 RepID=A0A1B9GMU4_9TREE|nr:hypothetical protein I316_06089 [Kwoniella heveanensis BCC8398]